MNHKHFHNNNSASFGGGIWSESSNLIVITSTFTNNSASDGDGIVSNLSVNLTNSDGGGIWSKFSDLSVSRSNFTDNTASKGGGIYLYDCSNCVQVKRLNNNIFHRNYAYFSGGAVHADFVNSKFSVRMPAVFRLTNTSFKNNLAGRIGGALASL